MALEPASVLAPQSAGTSSQVSLLFLVFRFLSRLEGADERTRTAYPCSLRVNCSYWTTLYFTLLDNRRYQRERWCVMQYIGRLRTCWSNKRHQRTCRERRVRG